MADDPPPAHHDPRVTPARPDLAAKHLENKVEAARYVEGRTRQVIAPQAPVRRQPRSDEGLDTEALKGELVTVYESTDEGWSWGQLQTDQHVGWLPTEALGDAGERATHRVAATRTLVFPGPSVKLPPLESLSFGCRLSISRIEPPFAVSDTYGFVPLRHLVDIDHRDADFVAVAKRFLGTPYLWGGRTSLGLDCSALVQLSVNAAGMPCWRDSDMQEQSLPAMTPAADLSDLQRGDLIFWPGHVAIVRDGSSLIHANGHHMAVVIEPIADAVARFREAGSGISSVRRLKGTAQ
jgi:hypothetical protein